MFNFEDFEPSLKRQFRLIADAGYGVLDAIKFKQVFLQKYMCVRDKMSGTVMTVHHKMFSDNK